MFFSRRKSPLRAELPDGSTVVLDRPFSEYTIDELAALGITSDMGDGASIALIKKVPADDPTQNRTGTT